MVKFLLSENGFRSHTSTQLRRGLSLFSLLCMLCGLYVNAQSQVTQDANSQSAEELEANKLNSDVVRLFREQKYKEALPLAKRVLALREQKLGLEHQATMVSMINLASVYSYLDKHKEAIEIYQRLLKIQENTFGNEDPKLCDTLTKLGWERIANDQENAAEAIFKRHLQIREKAFGIDHPNILPGLNDLALLYQRIGYIDQAIPLYRRMIAVQEQYPGEVSETVKAERLVKYAVLLRMKNKTAEADEMETRARKIYSARPSAPQPIKVSGGVLQGNAIMKVQPEYPSSAKQTRVQGSVKVSVEIDEAGIVIKASAVDGPVELRKASEEAAKKWRFAPTKLQGDPVRVIGVLTFNFTLQ